MANLLSLFDIAAIVCALCLFNRLTSRRGPPLPPGPTRLPLIKNLLNLPKGYNWYHWATYKEIYGPISSISVMGQDFIILNDHESAIDILERQSFNYSDRPSTPFVRMCGFSEVTPLLQPGKTFRAHRKMMHQFIGTREAFSQVQTVEVLEVRRFVSRILKTSANLQEQIKLFTGAIILKFSHGYTVDTEHSDPVVELVEKALEKVQKSLIPGKWIVNMFPSLKYLPDWFPGAGFKQTARLYNKCLNDMADIPHQFVKQQMAAGSAALSFESFFMEQNPSSEEESMIKWTAASLYGGGTDTSVASIYSFFLAMQLYPEVQRKAQAEIDSVVGGDRLPNFADRPKLPYVDALVKELLRWHVVSPLGFLHVSREDGIYHGYVIPKGSVIFANVWHMTHDPENYHDPHTFKPERFLGVDGRAPEMDPQDIVFGYGRRICPGKEIADSLMFISIVTFLATLNVNRACNEAGCEIEPKHEVTDALISHPKPFDCEIAARSTKARDIILAAEEGNDAATPSRIYLDL